MRLPRSWPPTSFGISAGAARQAWPNWRRELGSDVPFFLGRAARRVCRGRGERVEPVGACSPLALCRGSSARGTLDRRGLRAVPGAEQNRSRVEPLVAALRAGDARHLQRSGYTTAWKKRPRRCRRGSGDCSASLPARTAWPSQMSGSGTSYFGICRHARHARRGAAVASAGVGQVYAVRGCG